MELGVWDAMGCDYVDCVEGKGDVKITYGL